jgi:hypothetical protein
MRPIAKVTYIERVPNCRDYDCRRCGSMEACRYKTVERVWYVDFDHEFDRPWNEFNREDFELLDALCSRMADDIGNVTVEHVLMRTVSSDFPDSWLLDCDGSYVDTYPNGCPKKFPGLTRVEEVKRLVF